MSDEWREFEYLADKSQRCFNRLRDLPPYGENRWEHYFHKAFHIYSKLWKFQQDNRHALMDEGLKRWEIGDIASKIGQLYYNYYLRTSETRFLQESYVFYEAIRSRQYFLQAAGDASLAIKQLRYFARFIIICLLLNRKEEVWHLLQEFQALISSYLMKFAPTDAGEWKLVIQEVNTFLHADPGMPVQRLSAGTPFRFSLRCSPLCAEAKMLPHRSRVLEAVYVCYYPKQIKIAELPLDSFRMVQAMEWEDPSIPSTLGDADLLEPAGSGSGSGSVTAASVAGSLLSGHTGNGSSHAQRIGSGQENPVKHVVYRPSASVLLSILSSTAEHMQREGVMFVHLSVRSSPDSSSSSSANTSSMKAAPSTSCLTSEIRPGGVESPDYREGTESSFDTLIGGATVSPTSSMPGSLFLGPGKQQQQDVADMHLVPEDLLPLTRRSVLLLVDSDASHAWGRLYNMERGRPLYCFMSPATASTSLCDPQKNGSLMTMFMSAPLMALCLVTSSKEPVAEALVDLQVTLNTVMGEWGSIMNRALTATRSSWAPLFRDALLRRQMLRFVLAQAVLSLHSSYGNSQTNLPRCFPDLPMEVSPSAPAIITGVHRLVQQLGKEELFLDRPLSLPPSAAEAAEQQVALAAAAAAAASSPVGSAGGGSNGLHHAKGLQLGNGLPPSGLSAERLKGLSMNSPGRAAASTDSPGSRD